jgi:Ca2+-binding EF-hand superfamily protein
MSDEMKHQLGEFIKLQVYDDKYIDRDEEKNILSEAVKRNIPIDEALAVIRSIAEANDYVVERDVENQAKEMLELFANNDGKIDKKEFESALGVYKKATRGRVPDSKAKKCLKNIILDNGWKVKEGGLFGSKWFSEI